MKVRIPKHKEFTIKFEDDYDKQDEAWEKLDKLAKDFCVDGKSVYSEDFISTVEPKVKELQKEYEFTYEITEK